VQGTEVVIEDKDRVAKVQALARNGEVLVAAGRLSEARDAYRSALDLIIPVVAKRHINEVDPPILAARLNMALGLVYCWQGIPRPALEYCQQALEMSEAIAPRSLLTAEILNSIAFALYVQQLDLGGRNSTRKGLWISARPSPPVLLFPGRS
jgi:tetratricopeptide (TPR) repeat protein